MNYIVYESNTGFTREYAEMLAAKTNSQALALVQAEKNLEKGTAIFFLGWICAGKISGFKQAAKRFDIRAAAGVGISIPDDTMIPTMKEHNKITVPLYYLQGGVKPEALSPIKRKLLGMIADQYAKSAASTDTDWKMVDVMRIGGTFVDEKNLSEILAWFAEQK